MWNVVILTTCSGSSPRQIEPGEESPAMDNCWIVIKRELGAYFSTPLAYVFIVIFLALSGAMTFFLGAFFERGQADLQSFFSFHPWIYLFLIPAVAMRLWAEERKTGTIELLLTLPVSTTAVVIGKYLAAWIFIAIAVALTFPLWITVNFLGEPDNGVIIASYIGTLIMAGAYLAIGSCISALTRKTFEPRVRRLSITLTAKAVFPTPGRAPRTIRFPFLSPPITSFSFRRCVGTPANLPDWMASTMVL